MQGREDAERGNGSAVWVQQLPLTLNPDYVFMREAKFCKDGGRDEEMSPHKDAANKKTLFLL